MLYEILGISAITLNSILKKDYDLKEKIAELIFNGAMYAGLYSFFHYNQNSNELLAETYDFLVPTLFSLATITDFLKRKEKKLYETLEDKI